MYFFCIIEKKKFYFILWVLFIFNREFYTPPIQEPGRTKKNGVVFPNSEKEDPITHLFSCTFGSRRKKTRGYRDALAGKGSALETLRSRIFPHRWFVLWPGCFENRIFLSKHPIPFYIKILNQTTVFLKMLVWIDYVFHLSRWSR